MKSIKLKGGSLSSTWLCESRHKKFVRKAINLVHNREYGYVRWYSQMKKMQRLKSLHPEIIPTIIRASFKDDHAYFDMEYLEGYTDVKSLLRGETLSLDQIKIMHDKLWESFDLLHSGKHRPIESSLRLYYKEEVSQKIYDALLNDEFSSFADIEEFRYNGREIKNISHFIQPLNEFFCNSKLSTEENIHGNPTLENIMYSPSENKIMFIDLYEESIIDSKLLDYSQVLQCSSSGYGIINDGEVIIGYDSVEHRSFIPASLKLFNSLFLEELNKRHVDMKLVRVLEATQFIRMLPFKILAGDLDKAKFFYVHACKLLQDIFDAK